MNKAILLSFAILAMLSCSKRQNIVNESAVTKDEITFPIREPIENPAFTGEAFLKPLITLDSVFHFPQTNVVTFAPGSHSGWHRHGGMVVLVCDGVGFYQEEGKPAQVLRRGDVLQIPAGVRHWHGATQDNWFSQMVIYDMNWKPSVTHSDGDDTVTDEYYNGLEPVEYAHHTAIDGLMFDAPDSTMSLPTFNGPIRLANTLASDNVAGCPGLHYVVFEPDVINAWHTHAGGQVLIVTDGVGYHQIEGQPVEVLHPGDVAMCPPGVKHWHGAAPNSRFAHLAANTNPDKPGVEWFGILSKEEYDKLPKE